MRNDGGNSPVFLVGCQRSGTTALAMHLQRHPDLALTVNGKLLYLLIVWLLEQETHRDCGHPRLDEVAFAFARKAPYNLPAPAIRAVQAYLERSAARHLPHGGDPRAAIRAIVDDVYTIVRPGTRQVGDKYNEYLLQLPAIHSIYPDAKFIFVYRDPVDVAESMVRHFTGRPWAPANAVQALDKWASWNARWIAMRSILDPACYVELCYEQFVARPAPACARLFDFLGLPADKFLVAEASKVFVGSHVGKGRQLREKPEDECHAFFAALDRCQAMHRLLKAPVTGGLPGYASAAIHSTSLRMPCQN